MKFKTILAAMPQEVPVIVTQSEPPKTVVQTTMYDYIGTDEEEDLLSV